MEKDLPYARLNDEQLSKVKQLEHELRQASDEEIVLLAYQKADNGTSAQETL